MRRRTLVVALVAAAVACAAAFAAMLPPPARRLIPSGGDPREIAGSFHVHTNRSDGAGTVGEVAAAAARAGLQFVIVTDHGDATRPAEPPRYRSGVLCLDGVEISTTGGHYIALGLRRPAPYRLAGEPRDVVEDVARLGGFGIAAHPASRKAELRWNAWSEPVDALEWLNADSEWRDEPPRAIARAVAGYLFRGPEAIASLFDRPAVLDRWDAATRRRRVVGLAGHDAHARIGLRGNWEPGSGDYSLALPSYEAAFRTFALRVRLDERPTGDAVRDGRLLLGALRAGHVYTAVDAQASPARLTFSARAKDGTGEGGDDLIAAGPVALEARVPPTPDLTLVLLRNGRVASTVKGESLTYEHVPDGTGTTVYRVEARLDAAHAEWRVPWIVSNPIRIAAKAVPASLPRDLPPATAMRPLPADLQATPWLLERDATTAAALAPRPGRGVRLTYSLGGGPAHGQYAAAVLTLVPGTFEGWDRIRFRASASREMRASIQVREPRGGRRWLRSVVLFPGPRELVVRLDDMRVPEPVLAGRPPRAELASVLFVVDTTNTSPGTKGTMDIEDVRLEREPPMR